MGKLWSFEALDTLFFRDSRPMNAGETVWIESRFPPTGQTVQGAIRTAVLNHLEISFKNFNAKKVDPDIINRIGDGGGLGRLSLTGPFLSQGDELLFPVPLDLVRNQEEDFSMLIPAENPVESDLGNVCFPSTPEKGFKTIKSQFVTKTGMEMLLKGAAGPSLKDQLRLLFDEDAESNVIADREPKMGLARDNEKRASKEGYLFAIAPVRPRDDIRIAVEVDGLSTDDYPDEPFIQKLGGEGKLARVNVKDENLSLPSAALSDNGRVIRFKLVLTTPALMTVSGKDQWLPENFTNEPGDKTGWAGSINSINFRIITACIGKPFRLGGWNHQEHAPRKMRAYVPAGSVYFCEAEIGQKEAVMGLHGTKIGYRTEYGFGHVLVGKWQKEEIK